ncbi:ABC transporter permease [Ulvibacterium marinum]|uniref:ABC transporter permease n=1 Tax=Ulvibacterium marinum TaxID=2419782 RepID=A0A3B0BY52_9FLAO|nr:ABC transporter permease [Ulvibacterium marinum]RKN77982.1 ABC transporter permease [Ulvibacterium marinum]
MLKHNLKLFFRNIKKYKSTFLINVIGLSTGLACVLLIALWVVDELQVDKFHKNDTELYQVWNKFENPDGIKLAFWTPDMLAETMAEQLPEVKYASPFIPGGWLGNMPLTTEKETYKASGVFAGRDYFKMFSYELIKGTEDQVLTDISSIVISESLATKIFGSPDEAIGKALEWNALNTNETHTVSGIFKDLPSNSTQQFDFILPFERFVKLSPNIGRESSWTQNAPITYIVLEKGTNVERFAKKIAGFSKAQDDNVEADLFLKQYSTNYLHGNFENGKVVGGRIEYVYLFSAIALFILIIACINFMNLSTANATRRVKEIGIKKALGSQRRTLIWQYFGEAILTAFFSLLVAILIMAAILPQFNMITGKTLSLLPDFQTMAIILTTVLFTGLLAGSYPALHLSRFNPVAILKGKLKSATSEVWVRQGLVVFQFGLSIILIVAVLVVYKQIDFVQSKNLGMEKDNVIYFQKEGLLQSKSEAFLEKVNTIPGVLNATTAVQNFVGSQMNNTSGVRWPGQEEGTTIDFTDMGTSVGLIETLDIEVAEGRAFSKAFASDSTSAILFNETAIRTMGLKDPVGKTVNLWGEDRQIVGVVKDFHFQSFREAIRPMFFRLVPEKQTFLFMAKLAAGSERETLAQLKEIYGEFNPGYTFDYKFLDTDFQALYESENRVAVLSKYFAGLAILISCLGLLGLATFTAERRRKEISIRKVLGQTATQVTVMLTIEFAKLVIISILISLPLAYWLTSNWLSGFVYRIPLSFWYFLGAGIVALLVAMLTVGSQAIQAANKNPVNGLREE